MHIFSDVSSFSIVWFWTINFFFLFLCIDFKHPPFLFLCFSEMKFPVHFKLQGLEVGSSSFIVLGLLFYYKVIKKNALSLHAHLRYYTLPVLLVLSLISIWIFPLLTPSVLTPIHLYSALSSFFLAYGYSLLEKFFHWTFPNPESSGYPSTLYGFLISFGKLETV